MSDERRAPYLHIVGREGGVVGETSGERAARAARAGGEGAAAAEADGAADGDAAIGGAESGLAQALMYACVSWVALVREQTVQSVDLTLIGEMSYEADVLLADSGERVLLRVGLKVEPGSWRVRTVVEPARP